MGKTRQLKILTYFTIILIGMVIVFSFLAYKEENIFKHKINSFYKHKYQTIVTSFLTTSLDNMKKTAMDWSYWDDAYKFMSDKNTEFIKDNFPGNTLPNLGLDYMLFFNEKGLFFGVCNKDNIIKNNPLNFTPRKPKNGFVKIKESAYFYTASRILQSNGQGESKGILVVLKKISLKPLQNIIDSISFSPIPDKYKTYRLLGLKLGSTNKGNKEHIVLFDIHSKPITSISFNLQPNILSSVHSFMIVNLFAFTVLFIMISVVIMYIIFRHSYISKMTRLIDSIKNIKENFIYTPPPDINDKEFRIISETIMRLIDKIKESEYMFEKISEIIPAGIIICGETVVYANSYAKHLVRDDIIGKNVLDILQEQDRKIFKENIERRRKGEQLTTNHILQLNTPFKLIVYAVSTSIKYRGQYFSLSTFIDITELVNLNERYKRIVENLPYGVIHKFINLNKNNKITKENNIYVSPDIKQITGYDSTEIKTMKQWDEYITSGSIDKLEKLIENGKVEFEYRLKKKDGKIIWIKDISIVINKSENEYEILMLIEEITKRKKVSMFYQTLYKINNIRILAQDEHELLESICKCLAITCAFKFVWIGKIDKNGISIVSQYGDKEYKDVLIFADGAYSETINKNKNKQIEPIPVKKLNFGSISYSTTIPIIIENKVEYSLNVYSDIFNIFDEEFISLLRQLGTDISDSIKRIRHQQALLHEFYHDKLTGLKNITALKLDINSSETCTLIYLRISNLPTLNQVYGLSFSDKILKMSAKLLISIIKNSGEVYKIYGNRFAILIQKNIPKKEILKLIGYIKQQFTDFVIEERHIPLYLDIGISDFPFLVDDKKSLINSAEAALIESRKTKNIEFYSDDIKKAIEEHFEIEKYIKEAIKLRLFYFHYQPILNVKTGKIDKCEALIRLNKNKEELLNPERFISIAETTDLIKEITKIVIEDVLKETENLNYVDVAINISAKDTGDKNFSSFIKKKISGSNNSKRGISIEITERDIIENMENVQRLAKELKPFNVKIEIDDFGVKYSSLNRLIELDFDAIKIDKTLIDLIGNEKADSIIIYIIKLAHSLNANVVAEGVENQEQFDFLVENKCDYIQGYFISKPMPFTELTKFIENYSITTQEIIEI